MRTPARLVPVIFALILFASSTHAQIDRWGYWNNGVSESWWFSATEFNQENADAAIAKWEQIGNELKILSKRDWAGTYSIGSDTHGSYLRWSPQNGFVLAHIDKCQAKVMGLSYGKAEYASKKLVLRPDFSKSGKSHGHSHQAEPQTMTFVPIRWNGSLMLVSETAMSEFGYYLAGLGRYNYTDFTYLGYDVFYTRGIDAQDNVDDRQPLVPEGYERFLKKPITATIIRVGPTRVKKNYSYGNPDGSGMTHHEPVSLTTVFVDAGESKGLKPGMFLRVVGSEPEADRVRIIRVTKASAVGVIITEILQDRPESDNATEVDKARDDSKIRPGLKLTTSNY